MDNQKYNDAINNMSNVQKDLGFPMIIIMLT
jgi:hypothetical protein